MVGRAGLVREFLLGSTEGPSLFAPLVSELAAGMAQATVTELFTDPHALTTAYADVAQVYGLDCLMVSVPADVLGGSVGEDAGTDDVQTVVADSVKRLRHAVGSEIALGVALAGPLTMRRYVTTVASTPLEVLVSRLLQFAQAVHPSELDVLGIVEEVDLSSEDADVLTTALSPIWNAVRYYSRPSLFVARHSGPRVAKVGATAVAVWSGCEADELIGQGARRVGIPVALDTGVSPPPRPPEAFYTSRGEIPPDVDPEGLQAFVRQVQQL